MVRRASRLYRQNFCSNTANNMEKEYSQTERQRLFKGLCDEMSQLHEVKDADYNGAYEESLDEFGLIHAAAMLKHKVNRFKNIVETKKINVSGESMKDTLLDLASYAIMTAAWLDFHNKDV